MAGIATGFLTGLVLGGAAAAAAALFVPPVPPAGRKAPVPAVAAPPDMPAAAPAGTGDALPRPAEAPDPARAEAAPAPVMPPAPAPAPAVPPAADPGTAAAGERAALLRHAQPFTAGPGTALVAVVLVAAEGGTEFADLHLPVTVALPPGAEGIAAAARHAENGHEVAVLVEGPATPEAALAAAAALSASTAVLAPAAPAPAALARRLVERGIGLVAGPGARGALPQGAAPLYLTIAPGTPPADIARDFGRIGRDAMPGYGAIVVAPAEPAVLRALLDWHMTAGRGLALAPLSALLGEPR